MGKRVNRFSHRRGWRRMRLGDVVRNVNVNVRNPAAVGIERYVGLEHLDPESLHIRRWGLTAEGTTFTRQFKPGQVLFGKRRAYQRKIAVAEFEGVCSGDVLVFEPANSDLLPELLPFIVQSDGFFDRALGTSAGSLSPRTKWQSLATYEFALPPLDEQRRIAELLWAADEAVEQFLKAQLEADLLRRTALREFVLGERNGRLLKATSIGPIPQDWSMSRIGQAGEVLLGRQRAPKYQTGEFSRPYLRVANVFDGFLDLGDVLEMDFDEKDFETYVLRDGDVLLNEGQSRELVGRSCIYRGEIEGCCFQNTLIRFRANSNLFAEYAQAYFQYAFYNGVFAKIARQTTSVAHLGASRFADLEMPAPPLDEQREIVSHLRAIVHAQDDVTRTLSSLRQVQRTVRDSFEFC